MSDRREVRCGVVERIFVKRLILSKCIGAAEHELIAVGGGLRDPGSAGHAAGAADILDDHLLAQNLREALRQDASQDIEPAAGGRRNHHGQRPRRPLLRAGRCGCGQECGDHGNHSQVRHGSPDPISSKDCRTGMRRP
jgi:hypothetical protein